jgi:hypothetical protein
VAGKDGWTLDELSERVAAALAVDYAGVGNGRVRDVPDRRTIRWYTTIGLVDRPAEMRGRVALYGRRHLSQLVAIKRLQAQGLSLASIQRELVGATPETVERVARLPSDAGAAGPGNTDGASTAPARRRFWTAVPDDAPTTAGSAFPLATSTAGPVDAAGAHAAGAPATGVADAGQPAADAAAAAQVAASPGAEAGAAVAPVAALIPAVELAAGVTLLLPASPAVPGREHLAAIRAAADPLLDLLHQLGLDGSDETSRREDPR